MRETERQEMFDKTVEILNRYLADPEGHLVVSIGYMPSSGDLGSADGFQFADSNDEFIIMNLVALCKEGGMFHELMGHYIAAQLQPQPDPTSPITLN